jgi:nicotinamide-nucleotide amidase
MKKASIVSIGNELLNGQTISTNATYLSGRLLSIGIPVISSYTIGDDVDSIVRTLKLTSEDVDVVLVTGGLGPTDDDVTRQGLAKFFGRELLLQNELLERIKNFFAKRNLTMPEKTKVQAYIPAGAKALLNNLGTAPGIMAEYEGKLFVALPGVPAEMEEMFEKQILPELATSTTEQAIVMRKLKCFGAGESTVAELLGDVMKRGRNPLINCTAQHGVITLCIAATAKDKDTAEQMAEEDEKMLRKRLGELVYGKGEQTLAEVVGEKLARQKKTIAVAESCTGGTLAKLITDVAGASRYFTHGWVTYSNKAKTGELGVPADLIEKYGAVSGQISEAMADGAKKKAKTDFAIAMTGVAGPSGGNEQKPVGLAYISVVSDNHIETKRFIFSGNRQLIRLRAALTGLNMLRLQL